MFFDDWEHLSKPTIRPAIPSDVRSVARIHVEGWLSTYRGIVPDDLLDNLSPSDRERTWLRLIAGGDTGPFVYVAEHPRNGVVGFIAGTTERRDSPEYDAEIYVIYVDEPHQRTGIGRDLMHYATQVMIEAGCHGMLLWTFTGSPTNGFFSRLGGQEIERRHRSYGSHTIQETAYGWKNLYRLVADTDDEQEVAPEPATSDPSPLLSPERRDEVREPSKSDSDPDRT